MSAGIAEAVEVVRDARDRRIAPQSILALIRVYAAQPDRWRGPGVLYYRARRFRAGQSPDDLSLWPPASPEFVARDRARRQDESRAAAARETARQDQLAALRVEGEARLEREHGVFLDALSPERIERLAAYLAPATLRFVLPKLHRRPIEGSVRLALLELIDQPPGAEAPAGDWQKGTVR